MPGVIGTGYTVPIRVDPRAAIAGSKAAQTSLRKVGATASRITLIIKGLILAFGGVAGAAAVGLATYQIGKFEESMAKVLAVTQASEKNFASLNKVTRRLGATTVFTASQAAEAALFLARAGFTVAEIQSSLTGVLSLARAGGIELEVSANLVATVLRGFGLAASQAGRVTDVLAVASSRANTTIEELGQGMKFVAPVAAAFGVTLEETAAILGKLSDAGLKGAIAGTGLRRILSGLNNIKGPARKRLAELGIDIKDLDVRTRGVIPVLKELINAGVGGAEAFQLFRERGGTAFLALKNSTDTITELHDAILQATGRAQEMARVMDDTLFAALKAMISAASESALVMGDRGLGASMRNLTDNITGVISVWNGMLIEFARGRDLTREQITEFERMALSTEVAIKTTSTLVAIPLAAWILSTIPAMKIFIAVRAALFSPLLVLAANPFAAFIVALTAAAGAFVYFTTKFDTEAEKFKKTVENFESSTDRLREAAGKRNYTAQTFGSIYSPTSEQIELGNFGEIASSLAKEQIKLKTAVTKYISEAETGAKQILLAQFATTFGAFKPYDRNEIDANKLRKDLDKFQILKTRAQKLVESLNIEISDEVAIKIERELVLVGAGLKGYVSLFERARLDYYNKGLDKVASYQAGKEQADNFHKGFLEVTEEFLKNRIRLQTTVGNIGGFSTKGSADVQRIDKIGEFEQITQLETQAVLSRQNLEQLQARQIALETAGPTGIARFKAEESVQKDFIKLVDEQYISDLRDTIVNRHFTNINAAKQQFGAKSTALADAIKFENASYDDYIERLEKIPELLNSITESRFEAFRLGETAEAKNNYDDLISSIDGVKQAEVQLAEAKRTIGNASDSDILRSFGGDPTALLGTDIIAKEKARIEVIRIRQVLENQVTKTLEDQTNPINAILKQEMRIAEISGLTGNELLRKQSYFDAELVIKENLLSLTEKTGLSESELTENLANQLFLLREKIQLYEEESRIIERYGLNQDPSPRSVAAKSAFGDNKISERRNQLIQSEERLVAGGDGERDNTQDFKDRFLVSIDEMTEAARRPGEAIAQSLTTAIDSGISGFSRMTAEVITSGGSMSEVFKSLGQTIASSVLTTLIDIGVRTLLNLALTKTGIITTTAIQSTAIQATTAQQVASGASITSAHAPAAAATSLSSFGANSAFAIAGILAVLALISSFKKGGVVGLAAGGFVSGAGGPKSDSIPALLSNGEFVINASATKRNRNLLESINAQQFQSGGIVGGRAAGNSSTGVNLNVTVQNETRVPIEIEKREDEFGGRVLLVIKEALQGGDLDDDFEQFGVLRQPED